MIIINTINVRKYNHNCFIVEAINYGYKKNLLTKYNSLLPFDLQFVVDGAFMKIKSLLLVCCLGLMSHVFADNRHIHPKADLKPSTSSSLKNAFYPGYCEIEVINSSFDDVTVYGTFDDGSNLQPFTVYSFESPHYISLFYYSYCHRDMWLDIVTYNGYHVYSGFTRPDTTVRIVPYLAKQVKAEIKAK